eukprot:TRINITY_DN2934_c0_g1_i1.p1 TRINITY_DN2934_c0_g1~~TRINITY_DN2934_c0_g1_i1.p1  ORF type:complete len:184 (+),score=60.22 TRINITY_DN2934_c0_g1_i1:247-798(+)
MSLGESDSVYYSDLCGIFIVFDVTRGATLDAIFNWKSDLERKCPSIESIPIIILANKCDLIQQIPKTTMQKLDKYCKNEFTAWFETSAKDAQGRNSLGLLQATKLLINKMIRNKEDKENQRQTQTTIHHQSTTKKATGKGDPEERKKKKKKTTTMTMDNTKNEEKDDETDDDDNDEGQYDYEE